MELEDTLTIDDIENASYKDAWAVSARPQIQQLMAGSPDNHVTAMTLLIPWMDRLYTLESGESSKGKTRQVVAHFFPGIEGYELGRLTGFVIDLKHIGYAGKKSAILDSVQTINLMGNVEVKHDQRFSKPYTLVNDILLIHPTAFVEQVRVQIDKAFVNSAIEDAQA
ncbi:MAG: hypothetical protein OXT68_06995 [Chloroflexota bacterium]|nr:hypothetical protein [Chloroflexota bacterium]